MSVVAAAVIGGAVVSGYAANKASKRASKAASEGADAAAQAQIVSTEMQIEEMSRQFDYQMEVLQPQIQQQYNAQRAYSDLLGIGGPTYDPSFTQNQETGFVSQPRGMDEQRRIRQRDADSYQSFVDQGLMTQQRADQAIREIWDRPYDAQQMAMDNRARSEAGQFAGGQDPTRAQMGGPGSSGVRRMQRGTGGSFVDPNLDPTRLADIETLSGTVQENLLAGTGPEDDPYRNYLADSSLVAADLGSDVVRQDVEGRLLAEGAAGTGVYGDVFEASPGYSFQREEMERQLERVGSAGGPNIGGRAVMEAQRRAQGLAAGDYYNWAAGRERDLVRLGGAEATDAQRLDRTAYNYQDMQQGQQARMDRGYEDYLRRREGDVSRIDAAAANVDRLEGVDRQRQDQSYYNYLNNVAGLAGFGGGPAAQAVGASATQAGNVAGAYRSQGNQLSGIYSQAGADQANIAIGEQAAYNNAIQGGISNWITYQGMQNPGTTPAPA